MPDCLIIVILIAVAVIVTCQGQYSAVGVPDNSVQCLEALDDKSLKTQSGETLRVSGDDVNIGSSNYKCLKVLHNWFHILYDTGSDSVKCWTVREVALGAYFITEVRHGSLSEGQRASVNASFCKGKQSTSRQWSVITSDFSSGGICLSRLQATTFSVQLQQPTEDDINNNIWRCQGSYLNNCDRLRTLDFEFNACQTDDVIELTDSSTLACVGSFYQSGAGYQVLYSKDTANFYCMVIQSEHGGYISSMKLGVCDDNQATSKHHNTITEKHVRIMMQVLENCVSGAVIQRATTLLATISMIIACGI